MIWCWKCWTMSVAMKVFPEPVPRNTMPLDSAHLSNSSTWKDKINQLLQWESSGIT